MSFPMRAEPLVTPMRRGRLPAFSRRHTRMEEPELLLEDIRAFFRTLR
jgi:hypothetical protein